MVKVFFTPVKYVSNFGDLRIKKRKIIVLNIGWMRLSPLQWSKFGRTAAKWQKKNYMGLKFIIKIRFLGYRKSVCNYYPKSFSPFLLFSTVAHRFHCLSPLFKPRWFKYLKSRLKLGKFQLILHWIVENGQFIKRNTFSIKLLALEINGCLKHRGNLWE